MVAIGLMYTLAVYVAQRIGHTDVNLAGAFIGSLIPIALAYAVAHYFTLLVDAGQDTIFLAFHVREGVGHLRDCGFPADRECLLGPTRSGTYRWACSSSGTSSGWCSPTDRTMALFPSAQTAIRTQYAMLALMVLYTCTGLWLLSSG